MDGARRAWLRLFWVLWTVAAAVDSAAEDFRPNDEFNTVDNPNGAWGYGWTQSLGTEFTLYTKINAFAEKIQNWASEVLGLEPCFSYNPEDVYVEWWPPKWTSLHPGPNNEHSVLRWTAPDAGECLINVRFVGLHGGTTDVHVLHNETSIFDDLLNGHLEEKSFSDTIVAASGDTVDFVVGFGNGNHCCDTTGIDVTISLDSNPSPADTGLIYYSHGPDYYTMNPDGSEKTLVMLNLREWSEPSKDLHGGARWFLTVLPVGVDAETYPDGRPRYEIFAVSDGGARVRLTNDPTLQPFDPEQTVGPADLHGLRNLSLRWALKDRKVSWAARRWGKDSISGDDAVVEAGIYAVDLSVEVSGAPPPATPVRVALDAPTLELPGYGLAPDLLGHDWSPDGKVVVFGTSSGLFARDLSTGQTKQLAQSGAHPRCSPDGRTVAFDHDPQCGGIDAINLEDPGAVPGTSLPSDQKMLRCGAVWSPGGSHLAYVCRTPSEDPQPGAGGDDVGRSTAAGKECLILTRDIAQSAHPMGWRGVGGSESFRRGDADSNGSVNITDAIFTLNHLFLGGPAPVCPDAADGDDDGALQITDAIFLLNGLFLGGPQPPAPGAAACGSDPSEDGLGPCKYEGRC